MKRGGKNIIKKETHTYAHVRTAYKFNSTNTRQRRVESSNIHRLDILSGNGCTLCPEDNRLVPSLTQATEPLGESFPSSVSRFQCANTRETRRREEDIFLRRHVKRNKLRSYALFYLSLAVFPKKLIIAPCVSSSTPARGHDSKRFSFMIEEDLTSACDELLTPFLRFFFFSCLFFFFPKSKR